MSGPINYVNNGLQKAVYIPKRMDVSNVTNAKNAVVTTSENHGFNEGQSVLLFVPKSYGMQVRSRGLVSNVGATNFTVDIDTSNLLAFSTPMAIPNTPTAFTNAQVVADSGYWNNVGAP